MTHVSLFSGIGGIDLAAEWAGFRTVQFVEKDPFCQKVLAKHWPEVPIHDDITTFDGRGRTAELVSGGFPCQGVSRANRHATGLDDPRSGLVFHMLRVVDEIRPSWALFENSPSIRDRGYDRILCALKNIGYRAWGFLVSGGNVGLEQGRQRAFVVARLDSLGGGEELESLISDRLSRNGKREPTQAEPRWHNVVLRPDSEHCEVVRSNGEVILAPVFCRGMDGVPDRLDRGRALGNAVVPQQAYPIFKAIADYESAA